MGLFDFLFGKKGARQTTEGVSPSPDKSKSPLLKKVTVAPGVELPQAIAQYWSEIEPQGIDYIRITAHPDNNLALEQSKLGHYPCFPSGFAYPTDEWGNPMFLLAQINCSELPANNDLPSSGYLQFYISASGDVYGIDFDNLLQQKNFRVLFFEEEEVKNYKTDFSFLDDVISSEQLPVFCSHRLEFKMDRSYFGMADAVYEKQYNSIQKIIDRYPDPLHSELESDIYDYDPSPGHHLLGYAYFTQDDPRRGDEKLLDYILLLQIDTDDNIMWGDSGVANFFIRKEDLKKKDFSNILYSWDCC